MGRFLLQKTGPLASFTGEDASFLKEFLCRRKQDAVTWKAFFVKFFLLKVSEEV
jgi:hypothetical protein